MHYNRKLVNQNQALPDIGFEVCQIAFNLKSTTARDIILANKIIKTLSERQYHLAYQPINEGHELLYLQRPHLVTF